MEIKITRNGQGYYVVESPGYSIYITGSWNDMVVCVMSLLRNV